MHSVCVLTSFGLYFNQEFGGVQSSEHYSVPDLVFATGDQLGHGTMVAAMIVGRSMGVAKKATVVDVKVKDVGLPTIDEISHGLRWAINDIIAKGRKGKATINMSFGESSDILNDMY